MTVRRDRGCDRRRNGTPVVSHTADVWPNSDDEALYVHRLVVKRLARRPGRRRALLARAAELAAGAAGVRLDCLMENTTLASLYETLGFHHQGDVSGDNPPPFNASFRPRWQTRLYEKRVRP